MLIGSPDLDDDQFRALVDELSALIVKEGGSVNGVDVWGLRRLEYPIKHLESGRYAVLSHDSEAAAIKELERVASIKDEVLRVKTFVRGGK
jgi:small subunit ribosomal protein S6